jgi:aldoxime dehydratase
VPSSDRRFETAIPVHLQTARSRHKRVSESYRPPHPSFSARFDPKILQVAMAYFGIQYKEWTSAVDTALAHLSASFDGPDGPGHWDRASYVDEMEFVNIVVVAYWDVPEQFERWLNATENRRWWEDEARLSDGIGYFREIYLPRSEDSETIFSHTDKEGLSVLARAMSGEVQEHGYWGSARDRIPLSQVDALEARGSAEVIVDTNSSGRRIRIRPHQNLCIIRSGQDWGETDEAERRMYFEDVEPLLTAGMRFLRDEGRAIGCYSNRFVRMTDRTGQPIAKTYSVSLWRDLSDLERWAESHPTHLAIFVAAVRYFSELGLTAGLRLYHEVSVVRAEDQSFEYVNCHESTGMLAAVP